jgi:hypothetical protein
VREELECRARLHGLGVEPIVEIGVQVGVEAEEDADARHG